MNTAQPSTVDAAVEAATNARRAHRILAIPGRDQAASWSCDCGASAAGGVLDAFKHVDEVTVLAVAPIIRRAALLAAAALPLPHGGGFIDTTQQRSEEAGAARLRQAIRDLADESEER